MLLLLRTTTGETLEKLVGMTEEIKKSVQEAIKTTDRYSGQITMAMLMEKLAVFKDEHVEAVAAQTGNGLNQKAASVKAASQTLPRLKDGLPGYFYAVAGTDQTFWHVPKGWSFLPKSLRQLGWDMWI